MLKKVYVTVTDHPNVEMFVFIDRPGILYINLSCKTKGIVWIIPASPKETDHFA